MNHASMATTHLNARTFISRKYLKRNIPRLFANLGELDLFVQHGEIVNPT
jgi:hypothetical protein